MAEATVIAGLVVSGVVAGLCLFRYLAQLYADKDKCISKWKMCRSSKRMMALAFFGSAAIFTYHLAAYYKQGYWLRSDGVEVFWARYPAYAIAGGALVQMLGQFAWVDKSTRNIATLFIISFWTTAGVFGTLSPANHNWGYFGAGAASLAATFLSLFIGAHRIDNLGRAKMLWALAGAAALGLVWGLSPAGEAVISLEKAYLGFLITEALVFLATYKALILHYIPYKKAVAKTKYHHLVHVTSRKVKQSDIESDAGRTSSSSSSSSSGSDSSSDEQDSSDYY